MDELFKDKDGNDVKIEKNNKYIKEDIQGSDGFNDIEEFENSKYLKTAKSYDSDKFIDEAKDADKEFKTTAKEIQKLITQLDKGLASQAKKQSTDPKNWAYVSNLGYVKTQLEDTVNFLNGVNQ